MRARARIRNQGRDEGEREGVDKDQGARTLTRTKG